MSQFMEQQKAQMMRFQQNPLQQSTAQAQGQEFMYYN